MAIKQDLTHSHCIQDLLFVRSSSILSIVVQKAERDFLVPTGDIILYGRKVFDQPPSHHEGFSVFNGLSIKQLHQVSPYISHQK